MKIPNVLTVAKVHDDWCGTTPRPLPLPPKGLQADYPHFLHKATLVGFNPQPDPPKVPTPDGDTRGIIGPESQASLVGFNPQPDPPNEHPQVEQIDLLDFRLAVR